MGIWVSDSGFAGLDLGFKAKFFCFLLLLSYYYFSYNIVLCLLRVFLMWWRGGGGGGQYFMGSCVQGGEEVLWFGVFRGWGLGSRMPACL